MSNKRTTVEVPLEELRALLDNAELGFAGMGNDIVNKAIAVLRPLTGSASVWSDDWTATRAPAGPTH